MPQCIAAAARSFDTAILPIGAKPTQPGSSGPELLGCCLPLLQKVGELRLLPGNSVRCAVLVGRTGEGRRLLNQLTDVLSNRGYSLVDFGDDCGVGREGLLSAAVSNPQAPTCNAAGASEPTRKVVCTMLCCSRSCRVP